VIGSYPRRSVKGVVFCSVNAAFDGWQRALMRNRTPVLSSMLLQVSGQ